MLRILKRIEKSTITLPNSWTYQTVSGQSCCPVFEDSARKAGSQGEESWVFVYGEMLLGLVSSMSTKVIEQKTRQSEGLFEDLWPETFPLQRSISSSQNIDHSQNRRRMIALWRNRSFSWHRSMLGRSSMRSVVKIKTNKIAVLHRCPTKRWKL